MNSKESNLGAKALGFKDAAHRAKIERLANEQKYYGKHDYLNRVCHGCGLCHSIATRCRNKVCVECRRFQYAVLYNRLTYIIRNFTRPSHLIHQVFTAKSVPIGKVCPRDIITLREALAKVRGQRWFRDVVKGGFYFIEMNFNLESMTCNPHAHVLLEARIPSNTRPIDIEKGNRAWEKLTKTSLQAPQALRRFLYEEAEHLAAYIIKQEREGEPTINKLTGVIEGLKSELRHEVDAFSDLGETNGNTTSFQGSLDYAYEALKCLREEIEMVDELRFKLTKTYNIVFSNQKRYGFFGSWWGKSNNKMKEKMEWSCNSCGSTESEFFYSD